MEENTNRCLKCGGVLNEKTGSCLNCGNTCPDCGAIISENTGTCPNCGDETRDQISTIKDQKNSVLAAFLSFFFLGLGQVYNGDRLKGFGILTLATITLLSNLFIFSIIGAFVVLYAIFDSYTTAEKINSAKIPFKKSSFVNYALFFVLFIILCIVIGITRAWFVKQSYIYGY
jgi:TM2 domain-containing membrane protein YozV